MSVQVENREKNMAKLTIEVSAEKVEEALQQAYNKQKNSISLPGFRKGKVPRNMVEKMYGPEMFYEEAVNVMLQKEYGPAAKESGLDIVSNPEIDIVQIEKGKPFIFTALIAVRPEVTLGKYMGVTVTKIDTTVTEEDIDAEVERQRNNNARSITIEDRPVADGDTAVIDFEGFVDGEAFEGGKGENYPLVIGSHSFIDNFEEQLIGKNVGDELDVNVTFPEEYQAEELAGKPAVFKVKINEIKGKELPELDDEFAQDVSEFETLAEYREDLKEKIQKQKEDSAKREKEREAIRKIVDKSKMDIPAPMVEMQVNNIVNDFANRIAQQGLSMEQYMQFSGATIDSLKEQVRPEAVEQIQNSLVLEEIAKVENIEVTDEELDKEFERMAVAYRTDVENLRQYASDNEKQAVKNDLAIQKAVDLIMENIKERAKPRKKVKEETDKEEK
ncbi:MAG: trigger factor [Lachnospiraceae bacterium]|nr:trigger factor [Lachnospiraceae bacterium]